MIGSICLALRGKETFLKRKKGRRPGVRGKKRRRPKDKCQRRRPQPHSNHSIGATANERALAYPGPWGGGQERVPYTKEKKSVRKGEGRELRKKKKSPFDCGRENFGSGEVSIRSIKSSAPGRESDDHRKRVRGGGLRLRGEDSCRRKSLLCCQKGRATGKEETG